MQVTFTTLSGNGIYRALAWVRTVIGLIYYTNLSMCSLSSGRWEGSSDIYFLTSRPKVMANCIISSGCSLSNQSQSAGASRVLQGRIMYCSVISSSISLIGLWVVYVPGAVHTARVYYRLLLEGSQGFFHILLCLPFLFARGCGPRLQVKSRNI